MTEFFGGVLCWLGLHDWFYYERYNLEGERPTESRRCKRCPKQEIKGKIIIKHWE